MNNSGDLVIGMENLSSNLPDNGRVIITCKDGTVTSVKELDDNEHVATLNALIEIAKLAGYSIVKPDGNAL